MRFAIDVLRLVKSLPRTDIHQIMSRQIVRSATSVAANYRAACRAKSRADFIAKMAIVEEECDESLFWMELLIRAGDLKPGQVELLRKEGNELLSMVVASIRTARTHH